MKVAYLGLFAACSLIADTRSDAIHRIDSAEEVLHEIMQSPDRGIPRDLMQKAHCVGIVPSLKRAGFIVGAKYGKGVVTCRTACRKRMERSFDDRYRRRKHRTPDRLGRDGCGVHGHERERREPADERQVHDWR